MTTWRGIYLRLGPRLFWRTVLNHASKGVLPRRYDAAGEIHDRNMVLAAEDALAG